MDEYNSYGTRIFNSDNSSISTVKMSENFATLGKPAALHKAG